MSRFKLVFIGWIWDILMASAVLLLKLGIDGVTILKAKIIEAMDLKYADGSNMTGSDKLKWVAIQTAPLLLEKGKEFGTQELNVLIEMVLKVVKVGMLSQTS